MREQMLWSAVVLIAITFVVGGILKGCTQANDAYYALANQCIQSGGSWVPHGGADSYSGLCIRGAR